MQFSLTCWTCLAILCISTAQAGSDPLSPTGILGKDQADTRVTLMRLSESNDVVTEGKRGSAKLEVTLASMDVQYGLGSNWLVGFRTVYAHDKRSVDYGDSRIGPDVDSRMLNPLFWASYAVIPESTQAFALKTTFEVSPNTANSYPTSYTAGLTGSYTTSPQNKLFTTVSLSHTPNRLASDSYSVQTGTYWRTCDNLTLIPNIAYIASNATPTWSKDHQLSMGLAGQFKVSSRTYLTPQIAKYRNSAQGTHDGTLTISPSDGSYWAISLYHRY